MGIPIFFDPNNQNQDQGQGQGEGQGQLSLQGQGQAQAQIAADLNGNLNGNGNLNADGNLNGNINANINHSSDTVSVDVSVDGNITPLIGDLSDATALYMPQNIDQTFTAGGTDTAISLDQINSLVANNSAQDLHNSDHSSMWASGATETGGITVGDISQGALATGQLQGATSAAATVDAFTQSIVLGANIQNNSFTLALTGGDSHVSAADMGGHGHTG
jgi:hypothetical protein